MPDEHPPYYLQSWAPEHDKRSQNGQRKTLQTVVIADAKLFTGMANITLSELQTLAAAIIGDRWSQVKEILTWVQATRSAQRPSKVFKVSNTFEMEMINMKRKTYMSFYQSST